MEYLRPGHDLEKPGTVEPTEKGNEQQGRDGRQIARVEKRVGYAQETGPEAHVDHHDVAEEGADRSLSSRAFATNFIHGFSLIVKDLFKSK